jgi:hypothetical protein
MTLFWSTPWAVTDITAHGRQRSMLQLPEIGNPVATRRFYPEAQGRGGHFWRGVRRLPGQLPLLATGHPDLQMA